MKSLMEETVPQTKTLQSNEECEPNSHTHHSETQTMPCLVESLNQRQSMDVPEKEDVVLDAFQELLRNPAYTRVGSIPRTGLVETAQVHGERCETKEKCLSERSENDPSHINKVQYGNTVSFNLQEVKQHGRQVAYEVEHYF